MKITLMIFFDWATSLKRPFDQIPDIAEDLGFGIRRHPIGFIAAYLSERDAGLESYGVSGIARVNIFPPGEEMMEDIHSHGFDFKSGIVNGLLINTIHYPDWSATASEGEGFIGYETRVDDLGNNRTVQATGATVVIPRSEEQQLVPGETYTMRPRVDFHSVSAPAEEGAITLFCKTPTYAGHRGSSLVLKQPEQTKPPDKY